MTNMRYALYIWSFKSQTWFGNYRIDVFWSVRYNICFNSHTKFQGGLSKEIDQSEPFGGSITLEPQNNNSIFWRGIKRESSDKNRFCVSHEGLPDGLRTFNLLWFIQKCLTRAPAVLKTSRVPILFFLTKCPSQVVQSCTSVHRRQRLYVQNISLIFLKPFLIIETNVWNSFGALYVLQMPATIHKQNDHYEVDMHCIFTGLPTPMHLANLV